MAQLHKAHFFAVADQGMQQLVKRFLHSLDLYSNIDYQFTVMTPAWNPIALLHPSCEIIKYDNKKNYRPYWAGAVRFEMAAKAEVCFLVDVDMFVVDDLNPIVAEVMKSDKIFAALAKGNCFRGFSVWQNLFAMHELKIDRIHALADGTLSPPYFNYGFIGLRRDTMARIAPTVRKYVEAMQKFGTRFKGQLALCCAIAESGIGVQYLEETYNYSSHLPEVPDIKVIHYHQERDEINNRKVRLDFPRRTRVLNILYGRYQKKLFL